jgi:hypothetical protein
MGLQPIWHASTHRLLKCKFFNPFPKDYILLSTRQSFANDISTRGKHPTQLRDNSSAPCSFLGHYHKTSTAIDDLDLVLVVPKQDQQHHIYKLPAKPRNISWRIPPS